MKTKFEYFSEQFGRYVPERFIALCILLITNCSSSLAQSLAITQKDAIVYKECDLKNAVGILAKQTTVEKRKKQFGEDNCVFITTSTINGYVSPECFEQNKNPNPLLTGGKNPASSGAAGTSPFPPKPQPMEPVKPKPGIKFNEKDFLKDASNRNKILNSNK